MNDNSKRLPRTHFGVCVLLSICFLTGYAEETKAHVSPILAEVASYLKNSNQTVAEEVKSPPTPVYTGWNLAWADEYVNWGVDRQFLGHKLTTKIGFVRGKYDPFAKTYKAEPVVSILDTSIPNYFTILPYMVAGQKAAQSWTNNVGSIAVDIEVKNQQVKISDSVRPTEQIAIPFSDMLAQWTDFAARYSLVVSGKKYYVVPQTLWGNNTYYRGFVVTEGAPLFYTTNFPQDYVEVSREKDGQISYTPRAYSLPLQLTFELSTTQKNTWEIREMTEAERLHVLTEPLFQPKLNGGDAE